MVGRVAKHVVGLLDYCTTLKGEALFSLAFGFEVVVAFELSIPSPRVENFDAESNDESLRLNLDILDEFRESTRLRVASYKN